MSLASPLGFTMYPDWPDSAADLIPLPRCDGPKLKPFAFQCPQKMEFLDYLGEGSHAHVFKIKIQGQTYALTLESKLQAHQICILSYWLSRRFSLDSSTILIRWVLQNPTTPTILRH
jgi:hypothetical protein